MMTIFSISRHASMRRLALLLCLALPPLLSGCSLLSPADAPSAAQPTATREIAHDFTLTTLDGEPIHLQDLQGRWVLINFWATWCGPCRDEMPYLQQIYDDYTNQLTVLGVNMREAPDEIQPFIDEIGVDFPILLNPNDEMLLWYGPRGLPLTYVIAPDGSVAHKQFGPLEPETFDAWLAAHLSRP
jgi:thiol-disulfide isomerase/thioredoxin